jgi:hypothetical protein
MRQVTIIVFRGWRRTISGAAGSSGLGGMPSPFVGILCVRASHIRSRGRFANISARTPNILDEVELPHERVFLIVAALHVLFHKCYGFTIRQI